MTTALAAQSAGARMKSPEAFRTISEVSFDLDVPQHVLRFWESRFSQIKPVKRAGGRRFYRPEDVDLLRGIRSLLYFEGYTIKGVQKVLRDRGQRYVTEIGRGKTAGFGAPAAMPSINMAEEDISDVTALATLARVHAEASETLAQDALAEASLANENLAPDSLAGECEASEDLAPATLARESLVGELLAQEALAHEAVMREGLAEADIARDTLDEPRRVELELLLAELLQLKARLKKARELAA
jgi:DNA-binding transcriptional MerR regulator